jgi:hypothetical protein
LTVDARIVLCGSMSCYSLMEAVANRLEVNGIRALLPAPEDDRHTVLTQRAFLEFKRTVSRAYMKEIRRQATEAILVINAPKRGIDNYIGANTFAEIAVAFGSSKRIFVLNELYEPMKDELTAWRAEPLSGRLEVLVERLRPEPETSAQLKLLAAPIAA